MIRKGFSIIVFLLILAATAALGQSVNAPGRVSGKVSDDRGGVAANATVTLRPTGPAKVELYRTVTGKDGSYLFTNIPAGIYTLCIQSDDQNTHLNPCVWSDKPQTVTVSPANLTVVTNPTVEKGALLRVRINDPSLALVRKSPTDPVLLVGVWNAQHVFYPLAQVAKDSGGATYQANVPFATDLKVSLHGPAIQMQVDRAAAISGASTILPVRIEKTSTSKDLTIDVIGRTK